jgi:hypothetical protein
MDQVSVDGSISKPGTAAVSTRVVPVPSSRCLSPRLFLLDFHAMMHLSNPAGDITIFANNGGQNESEPDSPILPTSIACACALWRAARRLRVRFAQGLQLCDRSWDELGAKTADVCPSIFVRFRPKTLHAPAEPGAARDRGARQ